ARPAHALDLRDTEAAARSLQIQVVPFPVQSPDDLAAALQTMTTERAAAIIAFDDPVTHDNRRVIADFALRTRLPSISHRRAFAEAGGLMAYGPDFPDLFRRAGAYVDKVLKGAKPADLPVEEPTKFDLVLNGGTAALIGLTIPSPLRRRANDVIQ